jgi:hypothetical protein
MTTIRVQDCGCIALPEEIVEKASLYPGATLNIAIAPDGKSIQLTPLTTVPRPVNPDEGTTCA